MTRHQLQRLQILRWRYQSTAAQPAAQSVAAAKPAPAAKVDNPVKAAMKAAGDLAAAGKTDEAVAAYEKIGAVKSKKAEGWRLNNEGLAYLEAADPKADKAVPVLEKAVAVDPGNAVAWNNLGSAYEQTDKLEKAKDAYQSLSTRLKRRMETRIRLKLIWMLCRLSWTR